MSKSSVGLLSVEGVGVRVGLGYTLMKSQVRVPWFLALGMGMLTCSLRGKYFQSACLADWLTIGWLTTDWLVFFL